MPVLSSSFSMSYLRLLNFYCAATFILQWISVSYCPVSLWCRVVTYLKGF